MKQLLLFTVFLLLTSTLFSQNVRPEKTKGLFYKVALAGTLRTNPDHDIGKENSQFITLNGIFINNTFGYQFDERSVLGLNVEYDYYTKQHLNFLPIFATFRYNFYTYEDNIFLRAGYGKLVKVNNNFNNGTMYKVGLGYQIFDGNIRNSFILALDFTRKRFGYRQEEKLSSVSICFEFMLF